MDQKHDGSSVDTRAFVTYTRPYPAHEVIPALFSCGFSVIERAFDGQTRTLIGHVAPELILLAIDPRLPADVALIWELAGPGRTLVTLGPGGGAEGFPAALAAGADICLRDGDSREVFEAQFGAIMRRREVARGNGDNPGILYVGPLLVDLAARDVKLEGSAVALSPMEFNIFAYLARNAGTTVTHYQILRAVGVEPVDIRKARDMVKVYIRRIRQKLKADEDARDFIINVRGYGYMLERRGAEEQSLAPRQSVPALTPIR